VDLLESDDAYLAVFDAPGATSSDVQVRFEDNSVEVRIDRFRDFHDGFEMRFPGRGLSLDGTIHLPPDADVDPDEADATLRTNGSLEVRVPKVDATIPTDEGSDVTDDSPTEAEDDTDEDAAADGG